MYMYIYKISQEIYEKEHFWQQKTETACLSMRLNESHYIPTMEYHTVVKKNEAELSVSSQS